MAERSPYERAKSIWDTEGNLEYIFESNKLWAEECLKEDPEMFTRLKYAQAPKYLYIGCSDSRVPAQNMLGLTTGELFVHRNVANLCLVTDFSLLSVLTFAVEVLQVTDIIVCGHYGCGGVKAAMENKDHGLLEHWLMHIRNVQRLHQAELAAIPNEEARHQRLVELNVQEACMNLFANPVVQKKQATDAQPRIHGWVYDIGSGLLKDLKIDFRSEIKKYKNIYSLYEFPRADHLLEGSPEPIAPNGRMASLKNGAKAVAPAATSAVDTSLDPSSKEQSSGLWGRLTSLLP